MILMAMPKLDWNMLQREQYRANGKSQRKICGSIHSIVPYGRDMLIGRGGPAQKLSPPKTFCNFNNFGCPYLNLSTYHKLSWCAHLRPQISCPPIDKGT
jgi:hypothetical protein